jgi:hypothetical protein
LGGEVYINKYDAHIVEKEDESGYISKMFEPKMPVIINENKRNKWGSPRGYKVRMIRARCCQQGRAGVLHCDKQPSRGTV